jgi:CRP-like cAMP-binding protein
MANKRQRRVPARQDAQQNRLLAQLPADLYRKIAPELEAVSLQMGQVICEVGERLKYLYFPSKNAMLSLLVTSGDASAVEVGVTGWEGFAGFAPLLGTDVSPHQVIVQIPGAAVRITASAMQKFIRLNPDLRAHLLRYVQALLVQISQTALCNRVHSVEERLARWALVNQDRTEHHQLPLTHEFLARMLGVNRSTVSLTAATLQRAGIVRYTRGKFTILDRERLEEVACDCYRTVKEQYKRLGILT